MMDKPFYRTIFRLSLPAAFQALLSLLVVMADNVMVSRCGEGALAAVSQANSVTTLYQAALTGIAGGAMVLVSQYWGKRDIKRIRSVCAVCFMVSLATAAVTMAVILLFPKAVLALVISTAEVETGNLALAYFPIACLSFLPMAVSSALIGCLRSVEVVKVTLYTSLMSLVSNIVLNYGLIYGNLGMPKLGLPGAALATVLSRVLEMLVVCCYFFKVQTRLPLRARDLFKTERWVWPDYRRFGLPVMLADMQWALVCLLKAVCIGQVGKMMMDAVAVTDMLMNLGTLFTFSMAGSGACVMIGMAAGSGDMALTRTYSKRIQCLFALFGVLMSAIVYLVRDPFMSLYGLSGETRALTNDMIAICALTMLGTAYHAACFKGINRGAGDSRFVMAVDMVCGWVVVLPLTALAAFVFKWPYAIIYLCTRIDQCFKWLIALLRLRGSKWLHNVTRD